MGTSRMWLSPLLILIFRNLCQNISQLLVITCIPSPRNYLINGLNLLGFAQIHDNGIGLQKVSQGL